MFTYTSLYPIWLHGSQQQELFWLQQPEPGMEKMLFSPLLSFLKKPQAEHVAHAGSCLVFTLGMYFALWDRTHLKFHLFLWQISSFPAHWRTFLITAQEAAPEFPGKVSLWFLTRTVRLWKSSLRENFPAERFCLWQIEKYFLLSFQKCLIAWVDTSVKVLR